MNADSLRAGARRAVGSAPAAVQLAVAATVAYLVGVHVFGHALPFLAITVSLSSLGVVRDARPVRVLETAVLLTVGIALADVLLTVAGSGPWQIAVAIAVAIVVTRFFSADRALAVAAAIQSVIVLILPLPDGGPFTRTLDGLLGGAVALLATALLPRDPRRAANREADRMFSETSGALGMLAASARAGDVPGADASLERLRRTQPLLDEWAAAVDSAVGIARISPFLRRRLAGLREQQRVQRRMDLAVRNARVVVRRIAFVLGDGRRRPQLGDVLQALAAAVGVLGQAVRDDTLLPLARTELSRVAERLDPADLVPDAADSAADPTTVMLLRPLLVDLLTAAGVAEEDARRTLPAAT